MTDTPKTLLEVIRKERDSFDRRIRDLESKFYFDPETGLRISHPDKYGLISARDRLTEIIERHKS